MRKLKIQVEFKNEMKIRNNRNTQILIQRRFLDILYFV